MRILKEKLCDEFVELSMNTTLVASEESIRVLMTWHHRDGRLVNPMLLNVNDLPSVLESIHHKKERTHVQVFVEFNTRSLNSQKSPDQEGVRVHYAAMDVFCDTEGQIIVLLADHYFGKEFRYHQTEQAFQAKFSFPIFFVIAGGSEYQKDNAHCPFFSLQHLLLTAHDDELHERLVVMHRENTLSLANFLAWKETTFSPEGRIYLEVKKQYLCYSVWSQDPVPRLFKGKIKLVSLGIAAALSYSLDSFLPHAEKIVHELRLAGHFPKSTSLPWFSLPPRYNVYPQRMIEITNYVEQASEHGLCADAFDDAVTKNLVFFREGGRIQNRGIDRFAAEQCLWAIDTLSDETFDETTLIEICYKHRYPVAVDILTAFLEQNLVKYMIDFVFSNQFVLNMMALTVFVDSEKAYNETKAQKDFIFMLLRPSIMNLIGLKFLDPMGLLSQVSYIQHGVRRMNLKLMQQLKVNLEKIDTFYDNYQQDGMFTLTPYQLIDACISRFDISPVSVASSFFGASAMACEREAQEVVTEFDLT